ncbi:hypothetical protein [Erwinia sp. CGal63]|uniref:hypothetical protein n=1 Tax=Erwinia sp. CGal63 TaxID=2919889 RepID=UPI00300BF961
MQAEYYYVTQQPEPTDFHLLHRRGCQKMPQKDKLAFIGSFYAPMQALTIARVRFGSQVKACYFCCQVRHERQGRSPSPVTCRP